MARVLISAGHTMMDPGAIFQDFKEADLTRKIAPKIIPYLEKAGVEVQGVPLDLPLWQRLEWINNTGYTEEAGDILVEIHVNDSDGSKRGIEAWYKGSGNNASHKLATVLADVLSEEGYSSQGVKSEYEHELGSLTFLNRPNPAPVLLETLYMDHPEDIALLESDSELEKLAKAVAKGILRYLGKDSTGKTLPKDKLPKFDNLKTYQKNNDADLDIFDFGGTSIPVVPSPRTTPYAPSPKPVNSGFESNNPTFGGFGGGSKSGAGAFGGSSTMMDREQRKSMIEEKYVKILGRKPTQTDLNYFLNKGISEVDLVKKIADSQEHADIIKAKARLEELEKEFDNVKSVTRKMEATIRDQKDMMNNLNHLISHKNKAIQDLETAFTRTTGLPSQVAVNSELKVSSPKGTVADSMYKHNKTFSQKLFGFLRNRVN